MPSFLIEKKRCTCGKSGGRPHSVTRVRSYIGRDARGRTITQSRTVHGSKRKVRKVAAEMENGRKDRQTIAREKTTIAELLADYIADEVIPKMRERTRHDYVGLIDKHLIPLVGSVLVKKLAHAELYGLQRELLRRLSPRQAFYAFQVLSAALTYAQRIGLVDGNVARSFEFPRPARTSRATYDLATVARVLEAVADTAIQPMVQVGLRTGVRPGELMALETKGLNLEVRTLTVSRSLQRLPGQGLQFGPTKSGHSRRINLDPTTVAILKNHLVEQGKQRHLLGSGYDDHDLVFCWEDGRPRDPANVSKTFRKALDGVGLTEVRLVDLRHMFATIALESGESVTAVQEQLGHSSPVTTWSFYKDSIQGVQKDMVDRFGAKLDEIAPHVVDRKLTLDGLAALQAPA